MVHEKLRRPILRTRTEAALHVKHIGVVLVELAEAKRSAPLERIGQHLGIIFESRVLEVGVVLVFPLENEGADRVRAEADDKKKNPFDEPGVAAGDQQKRIVPDEKGRLREQVCGAFIVGDFREDARSRRLDESVPKIPSHLVQGTYPRRIDDDFDLFFRTLKHHTNSPLKARLEHAPSFGNNEDEIGGPDEGRHGSDRKGGVHQSP